MPGGGTGNDVAVAGSPGTSGGGDIITFQQSADLKANATYRLVIDGVKDALGNTFVPFTSLFTTGTGDEEPPAGTFTPVSGVDFQKVDTGKNGKYFASLVVHDGFLWTTTVGQGMFRYPILADGTLGAEQVINAFAGRAAIGLVFDRVNPKVAWVTHATANIGNESQRVRVQAEQGRLHARPAQPAWSPTCSSTCRARRRTTCPTRSSYGPGGQLYFLQGSNQAAGDPDGAWGNRGETLLTAAMLTFDPVATWQRVQASGAINVQTVDKGGPYDPFAANAPLKIYASGIRNAYDLVHTSTGRLFVPTNGTASGGNSPGVTSVGGAMNRTGQVPGDVTNVCNTRRIDGAPYTAPNGPGHHQPQHPARLPLRRRAGRLLRPPQPLPLRVGAQQRRPTRGRRLRRSASTPPAVAARPQLPRLGLRLRVQQVAQRRHRVPLQHLRRQAQGPADGRPLLQLRRRLHPGDRPRRDHQGRSGGSSIGGFSGFDDPLDIVEDLDTGNLYVNSYDQSSGQPRLYLLRVPQGQGGADVEASSRRVIGNQAVSAGQRTLEHDHAHQRGSGERDDHGAASVSGAGAAAFAAVATPSLPATLAPAARA